jgi:hypothetical protein
LSDALQLRSLRSSPPGRAQTGERRKVFGSALEQAEQLLGAASVSPPHVRPILVFYGLSQGVRAFFACSSELDREHFRTRGHGLTEKRLRGVDDA